MLLDGIIGRGFEIYRRNHFESNLPNISKMRRMAFSVLLTGNVFNDVVAHIQNGRIKKASLTVLPRYSGSDLHDLAQEMTGLKKPRY